MVRYREISQDLPSHVMLEQENLSRVYALNRGNPTTEEATLKKQDPSVVNDSIGLNEPTFITPGTVKSCNDDHCFKTFGFMHRGSNCKACGKVV
mgnify:CR=1 FL=1